MIYARLSDGFTDIRRVHGYTHERLIGAQSPQTMRYEIIIAHGRTSARM